MIRYRKPKKFRERNIFQRGYDRFSQTQSWKITRTVVLPSILAYAAYSQTWGHPERQSIISEAVVSVQYSAEHLPQFMLNALEIKGLSDELATRVKEQVTAEFPVSIFNLDRETLEQQINAIPEIDNIKIETIGGGNLVVTAEASRPVAIWRKNGKFQLISATGRNISSVYVPDSASDLPLVIGEGVDEAAYEIPLLTHLAEPLLDNALGFIRVGKRRWDLVLDSGLMIMLPEKDPLAAMSKIVSWEEQHAISSRRLSRIDLRIINKPLFRVISEEDALLYSIATSLNSLP